MCTSAEYHDLSEAAAISMIQDRITANTRAVLEDGNPRGSSAASGGGSIWRWIA